MPFFLGKEAKNLGIFKFIDFNFDDIIDIFNQNFDNFKILVDENPSLDIIFVVKNDEEGVENMLNFTEYIIRTKNKEYKWYFLNEDEVYRQLRNKNYYKDTEYKYEITIRNKKINS